VAGPSVSGSFIRSTSPVYPGASQDSFEVFPQERKSFEVLVQLRWAMKNALVPAPPFG
jgi:hypothetical protein